MKLGLIGDSIDASQSPALHRLAGEQAGIPVTYDLLVPARLGLSFPDTLAKVRAEGYRGVNVTYPWKEAAARLVSIPDPLVRRIGAVNTVIFGPDGPQGYNTDHGGAIAALSGRPLGRVALIGTGGVGRAIAFGLIRLNATDLRLVDRERDRAEALAHDLRAALPDLLPDSRPHSRSVTVHASAEAAAAGAEGLINATPLGMAGTPGTPLPAAALEAAAQQGAAWAFDAVYTPERTRFLADAAAAGLAVVSGWELFFHQGLKAFALFAGPVADPARLRADLRRSA